jgi:hypothetical protein
MNTSTRFLLIVGVLCIACDSRTHAQDDGRVWANAAIGYGAAHFSCDT